jgi:tetratricopeptide (TPR) repeat protein
MVHPVAIQPLFRYISSEMLPSRFPSILRFPLFIITLAISTPGCAITRFVGEGLSRMYENTVAYFNIYYNANKLFREAEGELLEAERANRAKGLPGLAQTGVPAATKQKFNVVIDKCSNILAFHQESALVDDALFLIGRSYYYQAEYVKAERKFAELVGQFPTSDLRPHAEIWLLRSMAMLSRHDDVIRQATSVLENLKSRPALMGEVYRTVASCYEKKDDLPRASENLQKALELLEDDDTRTETQKSLADLFFRAEDYRHAAPAYLKLSAMTGDDYLEYYGTIQAARCYRLTGLHDAALRLVDELRDNFRFSQYLDAILLERARILAARGAYAEAVEEYAFVDTVYSKTESGVRAAFEAAQLLEEKLGNYPAAWVNYARAGVGSVAEVSGTSRRKSAAFNNYFEAQKQISRLDSLVDLNAQANPDSADNSRADPGVRDSLKQLRAKLYYTLGELFYSEFNRPDSSVVYYRRALEGYRDTVMTPRAFFVLADLARLVPEGASRSSDEWYRQLVQEYPASPYSAEARKILGVQPTMQQQQDPAAEMFYEIERKIESRRYSEALLDLHVLTKRFPTSAFAAKSLYTIGWLYEYRLANPDSALGYYKLLLERYGGSLYASAVKEKLSPADGIAQPQSDTSAVKQDLSSPQTVPQVKDDDDLRTIRRQTPQSDQTTRKKEKENRRDD